MKIPLKVVLLSAVISGCVFGLPPKYQAAGATTTVQFEDRDRIVGQLIAAMPDHIIVLDSSNTLFRIYHTAIKSARFKGAGILIANRQGPADSVRSLLKGLSQYPQGISDSLLLVLRGEYRAAGPTVVRDDE